MKMKSNTKQRQKWYNQECHTLKKNLRNIGNLLAKYPNNTYLKHAFFTKKKEYKGLLRKLKRQFHSTMLEKIDTLAHSNPKEYWKLVNSIKKSQSPEGNNEISPSEWYEYFKNLNRDVNLYSVESRIESKIVKDFNR